MSKKRYPFIESKPIHRSQEHFDSEDDSEIIKIHVKINREFISTILYYGDDIEVIKPVHFRKVIGVISNNMAEKYTKTAK